MAAPMTSKAQTIASMVVVVAEGRCALMATYQIFQFIVVYALVQASGDCVPIDDSSCVLGPNTP